MTKGEVNPGFVSEETLKDVELASAKSSRGTRSSASISSSSYGTWNWSFSRRQWTFLLIFGLANLFRSVGILIAPPFYPPEAKDRGVSESEIGFVFGSYDFATAATVLLFGKFIIPKLGPQLVLKLSSLNFAICMVLFGCLDFIHDKKTFLACSFVIRIIAGAGDGGFYPSAFTIFAQEFEGNVSTAIGLFELMFGIGTIVGPIVFSSFIDYVGFAVVYSIVGICVFFCVCLNHFMVPKGSYSKPVVQTTAELERNDLQILLIPAIWVILFSLFTCAVSIGFLSATLESHLEQFDLTTFQTGVVFTLSNAIYTLTTPVWGKLSDILRNGWKYLTIIVGTGLITVGFSFLGPLPFLSKQSLLWSTLIGLAIHGLGIGGSVMSAFPHAADVAVGKGFPDTEKTFSFISSFYTLTFTLGNAIGPAVAGVLVDNVEFQNATWFVVSLSLFVITSTVVLVALQRRSK